jgi:hypothetical protein
MNSRVLKSPPGSQTLPEQKPELGGRMTKSGRHRVPSRPEKGAPPEHEGATDAEVDTDRTGPGAGYDQEPKKERIKGGVS